MQVQAKICGITRLDTARTALEGGADFLGFIHFPKSPRHLSLESMGDLMQAIRQTIRPSRLAAVVVDPDDEVLINLRDAVKPDLIQLHGKETPQRVAEIATLTKIPLIKAVSVGDAADIAAARVYEPHVDYLMFDAKAPKDAAMPGGLGLSFDGSLMRGYDGPKPWFLAGGLTPGNVAAAVEMSGACMVDVSSGVESAPGVKDSKLISGFLNAVKAI